MHSWGVKLVFINLLLLGLMISQNAQAQLTTIGREFYVGFMENYRIIPNRIDQATIIISAEEDASGVIQYVNNTISFSIRAGEQYVYEFPKDGLDIIHRTSRQVENKGVYIISNGNISVHAFNFRERSADGTVVLPLSSLGKDYWVTAHHENFAPGVNSGSNMNFESTLLIVAVEDDTSIEITLSAQSVEPIPVPPGAILTITLKKGESYQVKAVGDLTGTRVRVIGSEEGDCKNVAVFGGNKMTSIGQGCEDASTGDHLFQQIYPTFSWGKEYIHVPLAGRTSGEMVKVLASENNTRVFVNGQQRAVLNAGKFTTLLFDKDELANITSDKPIAVTVFAKSYKCNDQMDLDAIYGDPTMITLSPTPQLIKKTVFSSVKVVGIVEHFVNIIAKTASAEQTLLDGISVGNQFIPVPGNPEFSYARVKVSEGSHTLSNPDGIIGYAYGSGFIESYGYSAGASLNNLNFETEVKYDFEVTGDKVACLAETGAWTVLPRNPKFVNFEWTFGDGSEMKEGKTVEHLFEKPGTYQVKIVALTGDRACDEIEESYFEVVVVESKGILNGPVNVCPDIDEATYFYENVQHTDKVLWDIIGGEILSSDDYSVKVKWGNFNPEAKILAIPVTENGCLGDTLELKVLINEAIEPKEPMGQSKICFEEGTTYSYQVGDMIPNRAYEWFVEGGTILTDKYADQVEVQWGGIGTAGEIWYEEYSLINSSCGGPSKRLKIEINPPLALTVTSLSEFICAGSQDGQIELSVSGGSGVYIYQWSHDETLNSNRATDLSAGKYHVRVLDSGGCEIYLDELEIREASPMILSGEVEVKDAFCFGAADGQAIFTVAGGVAPYGINWQDAVILDSQIQLFGLKKGEYTLSIVDAVNCVFTVEFTVGEPEELTVEFFSESIACPGQDTGNLLVVPSGGLGPYIYRWEIDGNTSNQLSNIGAGDYTVSVTDANNCSKTFTGKMEEGIPQLRMPTGFRPDEGIYQGVSNCPVSFRLFIYNKWGQLIYAGTQGWDGKIEGKDAPLGSYTYMVEYSYILEETVVNKQQTGFFALIR
ncbi:PKD domain-containing protein [Fontibacter flavus]|uniref:PKD domain-containing protein n=1 Tax=Fontibacter flavus TaxID=654838 RepID=A0ABV6FQS8_9BACT